MHPSVFMRERIKIDGIQYVSSSSKKFFDGNFIEE